MEVLEVYRRKTVENSQIFDSGIISDSVSRGKSDLIPSLPSSSVQIQHKIGKKHELCSAAT